MGPFERQVEALSDAKFYYVARESPRLRLRYPMFLSESREYAEHFGDYIFLCDFRAGRGVNLRHIPATRDLTREKLSKELEEWGVYVDPNELGVSGEIPMLLGDTLPIPRRVDVRNTVAESLLSANFTHILMNEHFAGHVAQTVFVADPRRVRVL